MKGTSVYVRPSADPGIPSFETIRERLQKLKDKFVIEKDTLGEIISLIYNI